MRKALTSIIFLVLLASTAEAQEYLIMGPGSVTCGKFGQHYAKDPEHWENEFFIWAQGYMSGLNLSAHLWGSSEDLRVTSTDSQKAHIRSFCSNNPLKTYVEAVTELYHDMRQKQGLPRWHPAITGN